MLLITATKARTTWKTTTSTVENIVKDTKPATRKQFSSDKKIRIVLDGLLGEDSITELCRSESISQASATNGQRTS